MEIDQDNPRGVAQFGFGFHESLVGLSERTVYRRHENAALEVEHHDFAVHHPAPAGRAVVVGRPEQGQFVHVGEDVLLVPDMVAGSHHVNAGVQEVTGGFEGESEAAGGVFRVGGHQVDVELTAQLWQQARQGLPARFADYVADHQDSHSLFYNDGQGAR